MAAPYRIGSTLAAFSLLGHQCCVVRMCNCVRREQRLSDRVQVALEDRSRTEHAQGRLAGPSRFFRNEKTSTFAVFAGGKTLDADLLRICVSRLQTSFGRRQRSRRCLAARLSLFLTLVQVGLIPVLDSLLVLQRQRIGWMVDLGHQSGIDLFQEVIFLCQARDFVPLANIAA